MTDRERVAVLSAIREAILTQRFVLTPHAIFEMRLDRLDIIDLEAAVLTGELRRWFDDDARGRRYEVVGKACDLVTDVGVVCRFAGALLIITVYEITA